MKLEKKKKSELIDIIFRKDEVERDLRAKILDLTVETTNLTEELNQVVKSNNENNALIDNLRKRISKIANRSINILLIGAIGWLIAIILGIVLLS